MGGGNNWNENTAGLLLETASNTEIAVHDAGTRLASLMYYEGDRKNNITIGRDMGWGPINNVEIKGALTVKNQKVYPKIYVKRDIISKNSNVDKEGNWVVDYPEQGFIEVYTCLVIYQGYSLGVQFEPFLHSSSPDAIPQVSYVKLKSFDTNQARGTSYTSESKAALEADNTVLFTLVVIGS